MKRGNSQPFHPLGCKTADEYDAFTGWRKWLIGLERPGIVKKIKRSYWKRVRRADKDAIEEGLQDYYDSYHIDEEVDADYAYWICLQCGELFNEDSACWHQTRTNVEYLKAPVAQW